MSATSGAYGAGIEPGRAYSGNSTVDSLALFYGKINALGGTYAAGIRSACADSGYSTVDNFTLVNGAINARTPSDGDGTGSGYGNTGRSTVCILNILDGHVNASGRATGTGVGRIASTSLVLVLLIMNANSACLQFERFTHRSPLPNCKQAEFAWRRHTPDRAKNQWWWPWFLSNAILQLREGVERAIYARHHLSGESLSRQKVSGFMKRNSV
jgi:hypothetical protein